jgi:hypothetical protein
MIESTQFGRKVGLLFVGIAFGIYGYTLFAMKQEHFLDDSITPSVPIRQITTKQTPAVS